MPILYIHGVNVRSREGFLEIEPLLRRLVAPAISTDEAGVLIDDVFWGDVGATFAWEGASRPRSRLLGQGAGSVSITAAQGALTSATFPQTLKEVPDETKPAAKAGALISGKANDRRPTPVVSLKDFVDDELSDLLAAVITEQIVQPEKRPTLLIAADEVARDPDTRIALRAASTREEEIEILFQRISQKAKADIKLPPMGAGNWLLGVRDRLSETLNRATGLPAYSVSVAVAEVRKPLNDLVSVFLGDVFTYLDKRGDAASPGTIPRRLLEGLKKAHAAKKARNDEPLVVLTHSMGGQLVYDAVTYFLSGDPALTDLKIDFWCATASQVGLFEELKLFRASDSEKYHTGIPVPFPNKHLGVWWNVWDHNDFISYTTNTIVESVDDESYDSGMSLALAHGGYLKRPSFYRKFASKLKSAAAKGWRSI